MPAYDDWKCNPPREPQTLRVTVTIVVDVPIDPEDDDSRTMQWAADDVVSRIESALPSDDTWEYQSVTLTERERM
jgi:hypothetical protein